jgi:hypothetical protein
MSLPICCETYVSRYCYKVNEILYFFYSDVFYT